MIYTFLRVSNLESLPVQRKVALLLNQRAVNSLDDFIFFNENIEVILKNLKILILENYFISLHANSKMVKPMMNTSSRGGFSMDKAVKVTKGKFRKKTLFNTILVI